MSFLFVYTFALYTKYFYLQGTIGKIDSFLYLIYYILKDNREVEKINV